MCLHWVEVGFFSGGGFCWRSEDGLSGVVGVDLAGDPWTVTCYLLAADHGGVGLLFIITIPRSSLPAMSRAGFLLCFTAISPDW